MLRFRQNYGTILDQRFEGSYRKYRGTILDRYWIVIYTRFQFVAQPRQIVARFCLGQITI